MAEDLQDGVVQESCPECGRDAQTTQASPDWDVFASCENDHSWLMEEAPIPGLMES